MIARIENLMVRNTSQVTCKSLIKSAENGNVKLENQSEFELLSLKTGR